MRGAGEGGGAANPNKAENNALPIYVKIVL